MKKKKQHRKARQHARKSFVTNPAPRRRRRARHHKVHANPSRRRRRYRKNPESPMELGITLGVGALAAIAANKLASKLPFSNMIKNIALIALGGGLAYIGRKKPMLMGAGAGIFIAGATRAVVNAVPALAGDYELTGDEQQGYIQAVSGAVAGASMDGEFDMSGDEHDGFNGAVAGDFNSPSM